jgi:hypothetical protein
LRVVATVTILDDDRVSEVDARVDGAAVTIAPSEFLRATGWDLKAQGLCKGDVCVPVGPGDDVVVDGALDAEKVANLLGRSVVVDTESNVVAFGPSAAAVTERLDATRAPDFTLSQLDGTQFTFSAIGRKKKVLVTWASW